MSDGGRDGQRSLDLGSDHHRVRRRDAMGVADLPADKRREDGHASPLAADGRGEGAEVSAQDAVGLRPGDEVVHISGSWGGSNQPQIIESVNSKEFPDDPVAFFVGGGFWRTSRLARKPPAAGSTQPAPTSAIDVPQGARSQDSKPQP